MNTSPTSQTNIDGFLSHCTARLWLKRKKKRRSVTSIHWWVTTIDFNYLLHIAVKQEKTLFLAFALHLPRLSPSFGFTQASLVVAYPDSCTAKGEVSRLNTLEVKINNEIFPVIPSEFMQTLFNNNNVCVALTCTKTIASHFFMLSVYHTLILHFHHWFVHGNNSFNVFFSKPVQQSAQTEAVSPISGWERHSV